MHRPAQDLWPGRRPSSCREPGTFTPAAALYPVASARVGLGPALHPALTPMTPHERDPFVERSKRTIHTLGAAGIGPPTVIRLRLISVIPELCVSRMSETQDHTRASFVGIPALRVACPGLRAGASAGMTAPATYVIPGSCRAFGAAAVARDPYARIRLRTPSASRRPRARRPANSRWSALRTPSHIVQRSPAAARSRLAQTARRSIAHAQNRRDGTLAAKRAPSRCR